MSLDLGTRIGFVFDTDAMMSFQNGGGWDDLMEALTVAEGFDDLPEEFQSLILDAEKERN